MYGPPGTLAAPEGLAPPARWCVAAATLAVHGVLAVAWTAAARAPAAADATAAPAWQVPALFYVLPAPSSSRADGLTQVAAPEPDRDRLARLADAAIDARYVAGDSLPLGPKAAGIPDTESAMRRATGPGTVVLRVYVSIFGFPDRVEVRGAPRDREFALALQRALERTTFLPARQNGIDVPAYVDFEFRGPWLTALRAD